MEKRLAALGSALFFVVAPGTVVGIVPWLLTGWVVYEPLPYWTPVRAVGSVLFVAGIIVLIQAFVRFVVEGVGTPAPVAPTERLVVGGFYRWVRNPMYVALLAIILGEALVLGQWILLLYAAIAWGVTAVFVRYYEEPTLRRQFGSQYETYCRAVPAWLPRLTPRHQPPEPHDT